MLLCSARQSVVLGLEVPTKDGGDKDRVLIDRVEALDASGGPTASGSAGFTGALVARVLLALPAGTNPSTPGI